VKIPRPVRTTSRVALAACLVTAAFALTPLANLAGGTRTLTPKAEPLRKTLHAALDLPARGLTPCVDGFAGEYPCRNIDLLSFMPLAQIGGGNASDVEGWTDSTTGKEYAVLGRSNGTSFVDISDPVNPVYLGNLPTRAGTTPWREIGIYRDFALIVCDLCGNHGMQVFDLTRLRSVPTPPVTFDEDAVYSGVTTTHTISINAATGYAYLDGTTTCGGGGPHIVDIHDPLNPTFAGCFSTDGYTHDAQCVIYRGPDIDHRNRELCFLSNVDTLTIIDVTDHANPVQISRTPYAGVGFTHQGWLTRDQTTFIMDDELDELYFGHSTWTRFWNVTDLDAPTVVSIFKHSTPAIDHNQYVRGNLVFQSNYRAGLRIMRLTPTVREIAFFDVYPADDIAEFNGTWANYPFFKSGNVVIGGIEEGLFVVHPNLP
jgi:choice-of-anchor B domain-containing protein